MSVRAVLYCRVSISSQSVERQIRELTHVAERNNWTITETYTDFGISGSKGRNMRPELDRMMKDSIKRKHDVVMVWSIDRLGRSLQHLIEIVNDLESKSVDLYMHQQSIDTTTPTGKLMFSMIGAFAEFEKSVIRERVMSGLENAKAKGVVLGRKSNLTNENRAKILEMQSQGVTIRKIASKCAVGTQTVYKVIRAENSVHGASVGI
jgi:DNA invertase Pin-like site-specific DNA recombinase